MVESNTAREGRAFERFMASGYGRAARVVLGLALIGVGLGLVQGTAGLGMALVAIVPIAAGIFGLCPVAPLWGGHFIGSRYCSRPDPVKSGKASGRHLSSMRDGGAE